MEMITQVGVLSPRATRRVCVLDSFLFRYFAALCMTSKISTTKCNVVISTQEEPSLRAHRKVIASKPSTPSNSDWSFLSSGWHCL